MPPSVTLHALVLAVALAGGSDPVPAPVARGEATLRWKEKGQGVYGFIVLRSEERSGPFLRINGPLVRSDSPAGTVLKEYRFVDRDVQPGKTYYYALTAVLESGTKQRIPGVQKKTIEGPGNETARTSPAPSPGPLPEGAVSPR